MSNISCYRVLALALATFACNLVIAGAAVRVIDAESGAPISNAQVRLSRADAPAAGEWEAETNHEGIARLDGVHAASYFLAVEKEGYVDPAGAASGGRMVRLYDDDARNHLLLPVVRAAAISGRVADEEGRGLSGIRVVALKNVEAPERSGSITTAAEAFTDDRGRYRLHSLPPGEYTLAAEPVGAAISSRLRGIAYYPRQSAFASAELLKLAPGSELNSIDIGFPTPQAGSIHGTVSGIPGEWAGGVAAVALVTKTGSRFPVAFTRTDATGRFQIDGIAAGEYMALSWGPPSSLGFSDPPQGAQTLYASAGVAVYGGSTTDLGMALSPGISVRANPPADSQCAGAASLRLRTVEPWFGNWTFASQPTESGWLWTGIPPGTYRFELPGIEHACTFLGVQAGSETPPRRALPIEESTTLAVVTTPARGEVTGTVQFRGTPVTLASVFLWSAGAGIALETTTAANGVFRFSGLPPGQYTIGARFVTQADGLAAVRAAMRRQIQFELVNGEPAVLALHLDKED